MNNIEKGKLGEEIAAKYIVSKGGNINYGYPSEAVNYKKKQKITNVAKYYILNNCLDNISIRFDVIEVYLKSKKINHIVNAF